MEAPRQAVVLAAGKGTRLRKLDTKHPKPLIRIAGSPLLDHIRRGLAEAGVERIHVVVSHHAEQIEAHLKASPVPGQSATTVWQPVPQGTGQAMELAIPELRSEPVWIVYGDAMTEPCEYLQMAALFTSDICDMLIGIVETDDPSDSAAVYCNERMVVESIVPHPEKGTSTTNHATAGLFLARPSLFPHMKRLLPSSSGEYELVDAITHLIQTGGDVRAFPIAGWCHQVREPKDVNQIEALVKRTPDEEA